MFNKFFTSTITKKAFVLFYMTTISLNALVKNNYGSHDVVEYPENAEQAAPKFEKQIKSEKKYNENDKEKQIKRLEEDVKENILEEAVGKKSGGETNAVSMKEAFASHGMCFFPEDKDDNSAIMEIILKVLTSQASPIIAHRKLFDKILDDKLKDFFIYTFDISGKKCDYIFLVPKKEEQTWPSEWTQMPKNESLKKSLMQGIWQHTLKEISLKEFRKIEGSLDDSKKQFIKLVEQFFITRQQFVSIMAILNILKDNQLSAKEEHIFVKIFSGGPLSKNENDKVPNILFRLLEKLKKLQQSETDISMKKKLLQGLSENVMEKIEKMQSLEESDIKKIPSLLSGLLYNQFEKYFAIMPCFMFFLNAHGLSKNIAGFDIDDFKELRTFLDKSIKTRLLLIYSCLATKPLRSIIEKTTFKENMDVISVANPDALAYLPPIQDFTSFFNEAKRYPDAYFRIHGNMQKLVNCIAPPLGNYQERGIVHYFSWKKASSDMWQYVDLPAKAVVLDNAFAQGTKPPEGLKEEEIKKYTVNINTYFAGRYLTTQEALQKSIDIKKGTEKKGISEIFPTFIFITAKNIYCPLTLQKQKTDDAPLQIISGIPGDAVHLLDSFKIKGVTLDQIKEHLLFTKQDAKKIFFIEHLETDDFKGKFLAIKGPSVKVWNHSILTKLSNAKDSIIKGDISEVMDIILQIGKEMSFKEEFIKHYYNYSSKGLFPILKTLAERNERKEFSELFECAFNEKEEAANLIVLIIKDGSTALFKEEISKFLQEDGDYKGIVVAALIKAGKMEQGEKDIQKYLSTMERTQKAKILVALIDIGKIDTYKEQIFEYLNEVKKTKKISEDECDILIKLIQKGMEQGGKDIQKYLNTMERTQKAKILITFIDVGKIDTYKKQILEYLNEVKETKKISEDERDILIKLIQKGKAKEFKKEIEKAFKVSKKIDGWLREVLIKLIEFGEAKEFKTVIETALKNGDHVSKEEIIRCLFKKGLAEEFNAVIKEVKDDQINEEKEDDVLSSRLVEEEEDDVLSDDEINEETP